MQAELKAKWIAALRSGEYKQTVGQLHDAGAYCCLGVWCVLNGYRVVPEASDESEHMVAPDGYRQANDELVRPMRADSPMDMDTQDQLANMNDNGQSFAEIADWIDEHVEADDL